MSIWEHVIWLVPWVKDGRWVILKVQITELCIKLQVRSGAERKLTLPELESISQ